MGRKAWFVAIASFVAGGVLGAIGGSLKGALVTYIENQNRDQPPKGPKGA